MHCGLEFRPELEGRIATLKKALYGLSPVEIDGMLTLPRPCIIWVLNPQDMIMMCGLRCGQMIQVMTTYAPMWMIFLSWQKMLATT